MTVGLLVEPVAALPAAMLPLRWSYALRDRFTHDRTTRRLLGALMSPRLALQARRTPAAVALAARVRQARLLYPLQPNGPAERTLRDAVVSLPMEDFPWDTLLPRTSSDAVETGIILKAPQPSGERGVLYVAFEDQYSRLVRHARLDALARDYDLLLGPTWSPPYDLPTCVTARAWPGDVLWTMLSNFADAGPYARLHPRIRPIPVLASSWVDARLFAPRDVPKAFDLVIVSNFSPYKRHYALFAALAQAPRRLRVLVAGIPWLGVTESRLRRLAAEYGVEDQLTFLVNGTDEELRRAICSARAAVILSLNEGSCVAAAECLMLGVPLGMCARAHVGSLAFVNEHTGRRLRGGAARMGQDLVRLVDEAGELRPRDWMLAQGIDCVGSTGVANDAMRDVAIAAGRPWTAGLAVHRFVRLKPQYVDAADAERLAPLYADFPARYGVTIPVPASAGGA